MIFFWFFVFTKLSCAFNDELYRSIYLTQKTHRLLSETGSNTVHSFHFSEMIFGKNCETVAIKLSANCPKQICVRCAYIDACRLSIAAQHSICRTRTVYQFNYAQHRHSLVRRPNEWRCVSVRCGRGMRAIDFGDEKAMILQKNDMNR